MFKKLTLVFACALSAVIVLTGCSEESFSGSSSSSSSSSKASAKIDQSSKEEVLKSFFTAVVNKDANTIWDLMSPECQNKYLKKYKSKAEVIKFLQEFYCIVTQDSAKRALDDDKLFTNWLNDATTLVQIDGKWYMNKI